MKKYIKKFFAKKSNVAIFASILFIIFGAATYTLLGVYHAMQKMNGPHPDVDYFPPYPAINSVGKDLSLIKRGEYLAKAGDCIACHTNTAAKGAAFAGGLPMDTPFGTLYTPNITPDKETGIGNWTDEQFIKAMRDGKGLHAMLYYPAFPYYYFNSVTTDDLIAIKAYLDSIPAVNQPNQKDAMVWPFNWRFLQLGWRFLFFYSNANGPYQPNPKLTAQQNRGAYLVEGLGHCAMCHTPSHYLLTPDLPLGAPIKKYNLTGAKVQGYLAPNIAKSNLANVSDDEIVQVFTEDHMIGGGKIQGPMLEVNQDSLRYLSREDLYAIAAYLKTVDSELPPKPKTGSGGAGKAVYEAYCAGCHASGAGGAPKMGDGGAWDPILKQGIDTVYNNALKGINGMPAKGTCLSCTDQEIKQAVDYMTAAVAGKPVKIIPQVKPLTLEDGKRIYQDNCSVCHNGSFKNAPKLGDKAAWKACIQKGFLQTYTDVDTGNEGHPPHGACMDCTDAELIAAIKYMMTEGSDGNNYGLW